MSLSISIKSWLGFEESNESLMMKYVQSNNSKYLNVLLSRLSGDLYHYVLSQTDSNLAQDICQISWEKVIVRRLSYSDTGSFKSWLFQIARNSLIDELRRQQRWAFDEFYEEQHLVAEKPDPIELEDEQQRFDNAMNKLPFLQREAFILQQEGFRLREISKITGAEMETVKTRIRYAKSFLKAHLTSAVAE